MTRLLLGSGLALTLAFVLPGPASVSAVAAEGEARCAAPVGLTRAVYPLPRLARSLATDNPTAILVLNSASQPRRGAGKDKEVAPRAWPIFVEEWMKAAFPDGGVTVTTRNIPRAMAEGAVEELPAILAEQTPSLVIWQTGTYDAILGADLAEFARAVDRGVDLVQASGADVVLMNPQFSPRTSFAFQFGPYAENLRWAARYAGVPFFDRYGLMSFWDEMGTFDIDASNPSPSLYEDVHRCIGWLMTGMLRDGIETSAAISAR